MERPGPEASWLRKLWWFIWEDNSIWSWIVNIILAFVLIKFIVYPGLGWVLGTSYPIVAVVSGSMEHDGSFNEWWTSTCRKDLTTNELITQADLYAMQNISLEQFRRFSYQNGFNKGDIMILRSPKNAEMGDIIVFNADSRSDPIIHRVVSAGKVFKTKGDHNCFSAPFELQVPREKVLGKTLLRVPFLGWIKIIFVELLKLGGIA